MIKVKHTLVSISDYGTVLDSTTINDQSIKNKKRYLTNIEELFFKTVISHLIILSEKPDNTPIHQVIKLSEKQKERIISDHFRMLKK